MGWEDQILREQRCSLPVYGGSFGAFPVTPNLHSVDAHFYALFEARKKNEHNLSIRFCLLADLLTRFFFFVVAIGGANPLWNDALSKHTEHPYHVMIGGGDQLYCDSLLKEPEMEEWLGITSVIEREKIQCKPHWMEAIERYYFNRYCTWFSQGAYGQALAAIPSINMWDDHE